MPDADWIRDAMTVATIVTACGLAWLSVRVPKVLSRWWFWSISRASCSWSHS